MRSEVQVLPGPPFLSTRRLSGAVAQLGERLLCKQDVVGSIPSGSTNARSRRDRRFNHPLARLAKRDPQDRRGAIARLLRWCRVEMVRKKSFVKRVCAELLGSAPVLFDIVKRRFVRTSWVRKGHDLSQGTLNPLLMMGLPNRALERISRSWSFCANSIEADPAQDLVRGDDPFGIALS